LVLGMECRGRWRFPFLAYPRRKNRSALCQSPWPGHALWPPRRRCSNYLAFASVFSLIGDPPRRLYVNNVVRICIDTQIGFRIQRAHVIEMEMCCRASTSLLTKFAAVVNRALQFLPVRGHAQVARWVLPVPHSPITTAGSPRQGRPIYRLGWGQMEGSKRGHFRVAKSDIVGKFSMNVFRSSSSPVDCTQGSNSRAEDTNSRQ
jgi:hypothetical protein